MDFASGSSHQQNVTGETCAFERQPLSCSSSRIPTKPSKIQTALGKRTHGRRAQLYLRVTPTVMPRSQSWCTTYLLTSTAQRNSPVHRGHNQHHKVGQQPQVLLQLGLPDQVALQEMGGVSRSQAQGIRPHMRMWTTEWVVPAVRSACTTGGEQGSGSMHSCRGF